MTSHSVVTPVTTIGTTLGLAPVPVVAEWVRPGAGLADSNCSPLGQTSQSTGHGQRSRYSPAVLVRTRPHGPPHKPRCSSPVNYVNPGGSRGNGSGSTRRTHPVTTSDRRCVRRGAGRAGRRHGPVAGAAGNGTITIPVLPTDGALATRSSGDPLPQGDRPLPSADYAAGLAVLGLTAGSGLAAPEAHGCPKAAVGTPVGLLRPAVALAAARPWGTRALTLTSEQPA